MESTISEIRDCLENALGHPDVMLMNPYGENNPDSPDVDESGAERIARYWVYWNEYKGLLTRKERRLIIKYCMFDRPRNIQPSVLVEAGLAHVTSEIYKLAMKIKETSQNP